METDIAFCQAMVRELARGFRSMVKTVKNQKLRTATERLANFLFTTDRETGANGRIELTFEKRLLASYLGVTPENLSRAFKNLEDHGVRNGRTGIIIEDADALAELARPTP
jgi:CRP/FNR family transcriptional activator FtrB